MSKPTCFSIFLLNCLTFILLCKTCLSDSSAPLQTKDFFKKIYSNVCPSGELSCLREVVTSSFQLSLTRNNGGQVGSEEEIHLFQEKVNKIKTLSHYPPVFEIEDFFTENECEYAIDLATVKGLKPIPFLTNSKIMFMDEKEEMFKMWNLNGDDFVDANEVAYVYGKAGIFLTEKIVLDMFTSTELDSDDNGKLDNSEFEKIEQERIEKYLDDYITIEQKSGLNNSQQTWLWHDEDELLAFEDIFENYHERIAKVTGLPKKIIEQSEPIQVVKYGSDAHHECHHDTQIVSNDLECCEYGSVNCRLCRYITIMVYLTADFKGGEECFPFADNKTYSQKDLPRDYLKKCNLAESCDACNLVIKPKIGKAVFWYNHLINQRTGWMDTLDAFAAHGDCKTQGGEKWVAKIWIDILGDGKHELRSWKSGTNWIKPGTNDIEIYSILGKPDLKTKSDYLQVKERYSVEKNILPQMNIKINDINLHYPQYDTNKPVTNSHKEGVQPKPNTVSQRSRILQSVILLLEELDQNELETIAGVLRSKIKPTTV